MRLWTIHPRYLDAKGLVALWREALLAQKVLMGKTRGYRHHPQLNRFKMQKHPVSLMGSYLYSVYTESLRRGYSFDKSKIKRIPRRQVTAKIATTSGQKKHEFSHLNIKLKIRSKEDYKKLLAVKNIKTHPLFITKPGKIEDWEVV